MFLSILFRVALIYNCLPKNDYAITPSKIACVISCARRELSDVCYFKKGICQFEKTGDPAKRTGRKDVPGGECFFIQAKRSDVDEGDKKHDKKAAVQRANHGSPCYMDTNCTFEGAVCYYGSCLCKLGLYFSPSKGKCFRHCKDLGDTMSVYESASIDEHNRELYKSMNSIECMRQCIHRTDFVCLSVDMYKEGDLAVCGLADVGYLDVGPPYRERNQTGWKMAHRNCK